MNTSQQGYIFEKALLKRPLFEGNGRIATKEEQLQEQIDFIFNDDFDNHKVDIKYQPKAHKYGTINIELSEYNTFNPNIRRDSWWFTSTATMYVWFVGPDKYIIFLKEDLQKYVDAFITNEYNNLYEEMSRAGARRSSGNGYHAKEMSSNHGSVKFDNAETLRVPISILESIGETFTFDISNLF